MGSTNFSIVGFGSDISSVYQQLQDEAERVYGYQEGYSGHINCARGVLRKISLKGVNSDELLKLKPEAQNKELRKLCVGDFVGVSDTIRLYSDELCMRSSDEDSVFCIDLGIVYYSSQRMKRNTLSKRRFDSYAVHNLSGAVVARLDGRLESTFDYKLAELATNHGAGVYNVVGYLKNSTCVPVWRYTFTRTESRRQSKGCIPVHAYWYTGWAAE